MGGEILPVLGMASSGFFRGLREATDMLYPCRCTSSRGANINTEPTEIWVFHGAGARFAGGVFGNREAGLSWAAKHALTGVLTCYPLNEGAYDWALRSGAFAPKRPEHREAHFIGGFTSASMDHVHVEDGIPQ